MTARHMRTFRAGPADIVEIIPGDPAVRVGSVCHPPARLVWNVRNLAGKDASRAQPGGAAEKSALPVPPAPDGVDPAARAILDRVGPRHRYRTIDLGHGVTAGRDRIDRQTVRPGGKAKARSQYLSGGPGGRNG